MSSLEAISSLLVWQVFAVQYQQDRLVVAALEAVVASEAVSVAQS